MTLPLGAVGGSAAPAPDVVAPSEVAFSLAMLRQLSGSSPSDLVLSPSSLEAALAMVALGAKGATESGIISALQAGPMSAGMLASSFAALRDALSSAKDVTLDESDALFAERGVTARPAYVASLRADFATSLHVVDFETDPEGAIRSVNAFVDSGTKGLIPVLFPSPLSRATTFLLADAIYLQAKWATPFRHDATAPGTFYRSPRSSETVPFLHGSIPASFLERPGLTAVALPYAGGGLQALVLEPTSGSIGAFIAGLRPSVLTTTLAGLAHGSIDLSLPKLDLRSGESLNGPLEALGMTTAFSNSADLSGIAPYPPLQVSLVRQAATLRVDEAGTTAAAATGVGIIATALPANRAIIDIDRPFVFLVRDVPTGAIVFEAVVVEP